MSEEYITPGIVEFAYQIIDMNNRINYLEGRLKHEKEINKILTDSQSDSIKHGGEMLGIMLGAALDPNSNLNKGERAIAELQLKQGEMK